MMNRKEVPRITADSMRKHKQFVSRHDWKRFFAAVAQDAGSVRFAANAIHSVWKPVVSSYPSWKSVRYDFVTVYTNDPGAHNSLAAYATGTPEEFYSTVVALMKSHRAYVDYVRNSSAKIFETQDSHLFILIDQASKTIASEPIINDTFDKFSDLLLQKAIAPNATLMDVFFMLAYHTIDKIAFKPSQEMQDYVEESLRGLTAPCITQEYTNEDERVRAQIQSSGFHDFQPEELSGCYLDRSNQNRSINADNNVIHLCDDHIKKFAQSQAKLPYELVFDLVFGHEFGHLVFSGLDYANADRTLSEGRANFFASYLINMVDPNYVPLIARKTQQQPSYYQNPILITAENYLEKLFP